MTQNPTPSSPGKPQRVIYDAQNKSSSTGKLVRSEGDPPSTDVMVNEVYDGLGITYDFYWKVFGRHSIDNQGMPLLATVHFGAKYGNAFWNGKQLIIGDGDQDTFNRFSACLDIIAHQITIGIVYNEAQFIYYQQAGSLHESISDIFGILVKQYYRHESTSESDWLVGTGLFTSKINGKALRSLAAPGTAYDDPILGKDPQSTHMDQLYRGNDDNGGVHINCGIPSHAFYQIATALGGYSWEKAGRIWYETLLDKRLKEKAQFRDFARLTLANAQRLYGPFSVEAEAVKGGWEKVGIKIAKAQTA